MTWPFRGVGLFPSGEVKRTHSSIQKKKNLNRKLDFQQQTFTSIKRGMLFFCAFLFIILTPHAFGAHTLVDSNKICIGSGVGTSPTTFADPQLCGDACVAKQDGPYAFFVYTGSNGPNPGTCTCTNECTDKADWTGFNIYSIEVVPTVIPTAAPQAAGAHTLLDSNKICIGGTGYGFSTTFTDPQLCGDGCVAKVNGPFTYFTFNRPNGPSPGQCTCTNECSSKSTWAGIDIYLISNPSKSPSATPTVAPSANPTMVPTAVPSANPTAAPSQVPTVSPSFIPTVTPTEATVNLCIAGYYCDFVADSIDTGIVGSVQDCANECAIQNYKYCDYEDTTGSCFCDNDCPEFTDGGATWSSYSINSNECTTSKSPTVIPTVVPSATPTVDPTASPSADPTAVPSYDPTASPSFEPTASPSADPTMTPTVNPTAVPTYSPTVVPTVTPTETPSTSPSHSPTHIPTADPSVVPTVIPSFIPTMTPTSIPTYSPTETPTIVPSVIPTATPSVVPSASPTVLPTAIPSATPSTSPSATPTIAPTTTPTASPSYVPSFTPTAAPTVVPSAIPSVTPSVSPSVSPTAVPTAIPTAIPTYAPSFTPSAVSSAFPSSQPSSHPTGEPSTQPTNRPTMPTFSPTAIPTAIPTSRTKASIKVNAGFTFTSVNGAFLNPTSQETIKQSIANASHTTANNVDLVSVTRADTSRRLLLRVEEPAIHALAATLFKYNVVADIHFNLIDFPESFNASYVAEMKSKQIVRAVNTGIMNQIVRYYAIANNASQLLNSTAANITVLSTAITPAPGASSSESSNLSDGQIAGLVVGVTLGGLLLIVLFFWIVTASKSRKENSKVRHSPSDNEADGMLSSDQQQVIR
jgi:hypothetical protein